MPISRPNPNIPLSATQPQFATMLTQLNNNMSADRTNASNLQTAALQRTATQQNIDINAGVLQKATELDQAKEVILLTNSLPDILRRGDKTSIGQTLQGIRDLSEQLGAEDFELIDNVSMMAMMNPDMAADYLEQDLLPALRPLHEAFAPSTEVDAARGQTITTDPLNPRNPTATPIVGAVQPASGSSRYSQFSILDSGQTQAFDKTTGNMVIIPQAHTLSPDTDDVTKYSNFNIDDATGVTTALFNGEIVIVPAGVAAQAARIDSSGVDSKYSNLTEQNDGTFLALNNITNKIELVPVGELATESIAGQPDDDATIRQRNDEIASLVSQDIDLQTAERIVDGVIRVEMTDVGTIRLIDTALAATGESNAVRELAVSSMSNSQQEVLIPRTLYDTARNAAGFFPGLGDAFTRFFGQIPGVEAPTTSGEARALINLAQEPMLSTMRQSPRFSESEVARFQENIDIGASLFDSGEALQGRMVVVDGFLRIRRGQEQNTANNTGLPLAERQSALRIVDDIDNYLKFLGVPQVPTGEDFNLDFITNTDINQLRSISNRMTDDQLLDLRSNNPEVFRAMFDRFTER
tara:strand:+ start:1731 stop:3473 length:1743 start_codon:yes stop_codon:yes gene_type:complete